MAQSPCFRRNCSATQQASICSVPTTTYRPRNQGLCGHAWKDCRRTVFGPPRRSGCDHLLTEPGSLRYADGTARPMRSSARSEASVIARSHAANPITFRRRTSRGLSNRNSPSVAYKLITKTEKPPRPAHDSLLSCFRNARFTGAQV